jgi:hypothetical protein
MHTLVYARVAACSQRTASVLSYTRPALGKWGGWNLTPALLAGNSVGMGLIARLGTFFTRFIFSIATPVYTITTTNYSMIVNFTGTSWNTFGYCSILFSAVL